MDLDLHMGTNLPGIGLIGALVGYRSLEMYNRLYRSVVRFLLDEIMLESDLERY